MKDILYITSLFKVKITNKLLSSYLLVTRTCCGLMLIYSTSFSSNLGISWILLLYLGGVMLLLGFFTPIMALTQLGYILATSWGAFQSYGINLLSYPFMYQINLLLIVLVAMLAVIGAGKYSFDYMIFGYDIKNVAGRKFKSLKLLKQA